MFETATYAPGAFDFSIEREPACRAKTTDSLTDGLAAFLLRVAAYFQGCLASLPRANNIPQESLTVIDTALESGSGPLQKVRMNRALSRRLRWLIRRGRVQRSGKIRLVTADDEARCTLTPGQFNEYSIRVHGMSRIRIYGMGWGRRALRLRSILSVLLSGDVLSLRKAALCCAPLSPD